MIIIAFFLVGELCHTSGWIDIPTPTQYDIPGMIGGELAFSLPFSKEDPNPADDQEPDPEDFSLAFRYGLGGRGELAVAMYTPTSYALSMSYTLSQEEGGKPAFFMGVDDITYNTHISTRGTGDSTGFIEERNYAVRNNGRPWELFSTYLGMQKSIGPALSFVMGIGRGRFVGYGPRSHIFNTDLFILGEDYKTEDHSWWAFGLFFGGALRFPFGLELIAEIDGRDGNAGLKYHTKAVALTLALTKCEHFWSPEPYSPRFTAGLEFSNRAALGGPSVGTIDCIVKDNTTKMLLSGYIVDIKEVNRRYKAKGSSFKLSLPAGNYTLTITKPNYVDYVAKISVKTGVKTKLIFNLKKTAEAQEKTKVLKEKEQNIKANFEKGKIYFSEGNLTEAETAFKAVLTLDPTHAGAKDYLAKIGPRRNQLINVYSAEARSREGAKDYTKAIEYWNKVLALDSENKQAKTALANLKEKMAPPKKPTGQTKPPVATKPSKAEIDALYKKGISYYNAEKYQQALKTFKQVLALDPNHAGAKDYKKRATARLKILEGGG